MLLELPPVGRCSFAPQGGADLRIALQNSELDLLSSVLFGHVCMPFPHLLQCELAICITSWGQRILNLSQAELPTN